MTAQDLPDIQIQRYLRAATWALWGEFRALARLELEAHLRQRAQDYTMRGETPQRAVRLAIRDLGAASSVLFGLWRAHLTMLSLDVLTLAFAPFRHRLLESLLISLAIALGVGVTTSMLTLLAVGTQERTRILDSAQGRSLQLIAADDFGSLSAADTSAVAQRIDPGPPLNFTPQDLNSLKQSVPAAQYVYASTSTGGMLRAPGGALDVTSITEDYLPTTDLHLQRGQWFTTQEYTEGRAVTVLSTDVARAMFGARDPLGQSALIGDKAYRVVGVYLRSDPTQPRALVPWPTGTAVNLRALTLVAYPKRVAEATSQLSALATRLYGPRAEVVNTAALLRAQQATARRTAVLLALFASGGLLIAAINVTNLMITRVLARTRGIGVSGALGASSGLVFRLYLAEACALGLVGGSLGVLLATGFIAALNEMLAQADPILHSSLTGALTSGGMLQLNLGILVTGVGVSLLVCVLFGSYPAALAARVRPAEALRA